MKKYFLHCLLFVSLSHSINISAQITAEFFGTKEVFRALAKRILIVEMLVENPNVITKLNKKENGAKQVLNYKKFIKKYNEYIQITAYKYWKYNDSIEFRNELEVHELKKTHTNKYALLSYMELKDHEAGENPEAIYAIPAIKYTRIEAVVDKPDYKIYIPSSYIRRDNKYIEADFRVAIMAMQENIKYVMKFKESIEFQEFILDMADKNCKKLKRSTVLVEKNMLAKELTEEKAKSHCKIKVEFVSIDDIEQHMFYKTKGKSAIIAFPFAILEGKGASGLISSVVYFKIAVDCETGNIIWTNGSSLGHITYDKNNSQFMTERDFKHMQPCE